MISEKLFVGIYKSIVLYFAEYQTERKGRLSIDKSTNSFGYKAMLNHLESNLIILILSIFSAKQSGKLPQPFHAVVHATEP